MPTTRPKLRPTLSRKTKYVTIAPNAERKLGREAGRKEHDLRKMVGHANFLDTLMDELGISPDEEEDQAARSDEGVAGTDEASRHDLPIEQTDETRQEHWTDPVAPGSDTEEVEAEEVWSSDSTDEEGISSTDEEDDQEHALVRTPTHIRVRIGDVDPKTPMIEHDGHGVSTVTVSEHGQGLSIAEAIQNRRKGGLQVSLTEIINEIEYDRSDRLTPWPVPASKAEDASRDYFASATAAAA